MPDRPHILVLFSDQMQHDRMDSVDGIAHTPNLNRLVEEGIHFTHMITQQGQCVPSRAVFLTGQSAHECGVMVNCGFKGPGGVHEEKITAKNTTFAHVLKAHGYRTVYFGKGHLFSPIEDLGFDEGAVNDEIEISDKEAAGSGLAHVPRLLRRDYASTEWAVDYLKKYRSDEKPLCFFFSTNLPHPPFFSEIKYAYLFPPENLKLPQSFYKESFEGKPPYQKEHAEDGRHGAFDEEQMRKETADYYTMIAKMDEQFGEVISEFKRLGLWDNTLVIFISDHGDMMGAHRMRLKGVIPYDELYRVPMIVKLPKGMKSKRSTIDDLLSSQAVAGTILKLVGCDVPEDFTGGNFAHLFESDEHPEDEKVFFEHYLAYWGYHPFYGVRTRIAKYIRYYGPDDTEEMYDLERDPHELKNVASDPAYETLKAELSKEADDWWQATSGRDAEYYESAEFRNNSHNL
jgi:choline-sulfatase